MALDGLDREHVYDLFEKAVKDYICKFPAGSSEGVRWAHLASLCLRGLYCEVLLPSKEHSSSDWKDWSSFIIIIVCGFQLKL